MTEQFFTPYKSFPAALIIGGLFLANGFDSTDFYTEILIRLLGILLIIWGIYRSQS